jgi:hypothetical protein
MGDNFEIMTDNVLALACLGPNNFEFRSARTKPSHRFSFPSQNSSRFRNPRSLVAISAFPPHRLARALFGASKPTQGRAADHLAGFDERLASTSPRRGGGDQRSRIQRPHGCYCIFEQLNGHGGLPASVASEDAGEGDEAAAVHKGDGPP